MREIPDCASVNQHRRRVYGTADARGEGDRENLVFRNIQAHLRQVITYFFVHLRRTSHTRVSYLTMYDSASGQFFPLPCPLPSL